LLPFPVGHRPNFGTREARATTEAAGRIARIVEEEEEAMLASWKGIALALGLGFVLCGSAAADEPDQSQAEPSAQAEQAAPARPAGQNAAAAAPVLYEDALIGLTVRDKMGHVVGEVQNAVVGLPGGFVRYVVVASEALSGDEDGMVALPWKSFEVKRNNGEAQFVQLRIDAKTAAAAPKLLEDQTWPASLPKAFLARVDREIGVQRAELGYRGAPPNKGVKTSTWRLYQLEGANVRSAAGEDIGEVENLAINSRTGHIEFVTIDSGGFLDLEYGYHALPIQALRVVPASEEYEPVLQLAISNEQYAQTPVAAGNATAATIRERVRNFEQTHLRQPAQTRPSARPAETQQQ
jgi:sporulation protein YlmC with PRC-barrel domain